MEFFDRAIMYFVGIGAAIAVLGCIIAMGAIMQDMLRDFLNPGDGPPP